jgi:hypothetical protein
VVVSGIWEQYCSHLFFFLLGNIPKAFMTNE